MMNSSSENFEIRGSLNTTIGKLFLLIFGVIFTFSFSVFLVKLLNDSLYIWQVPSIVIILFLFFLVWIFSHRLAVSNGTILYRSLMSKTSVKLSEIKRVKYLNTYRSYSERGKLYPKIVLSPSAKGENGSVEITLSVFSYEDLQRFYALLESLEKLPFKRNAGRVKIINPKH